MARGSLAMDTPVHVARDLFNCPLQVLIITFSMPSTRYNLRSNPLYTDENMSTPQSPTEEMQAAPTAHSEDEPFMPDQD
jgi:hypothetical protein